MRSNLLLLHGALGSSVQLEPLAGILEGKYRTILYNFSGHGGKPIPDEPFGTSMFADEIKQLIEKTRLAPCDIFGYSMGGYAALLAAKNNPGLTGRIFTLGTKFDWNEETSAKEAGMLNPEKIAEKLPSFAKSLAERHFPADWKAVVSKTAKMMLSLGKMPELTLNDMMQIEIYVTVAVGDKDNMVTVEESKNAAGNLINGKLLVIPDTLHPLEKVNIQKLASEISQFID